MLIDTSLVYHNIRGQTVIKLYVIFNLLEILDKLLVRDARARRSRVCRLTFANSARSDRMRLNRSFGQCESGNSCRRATTTRYWCRT